MPNLIDSVNAHIAHNFDGLDYLVRDKNAFHARDGSVVFKTPFPKAELAIRKKLNLAMTKVEGKCMRALFYDWQRAVISNPMEANSIRTMNLGSAVESVEQNYYRALGVLHSAHIRLWNPEYNISGEIDNLVWEYEDEIDAKTGSITGKVIIKEPRRLIGVEIKSFYGYYAEREILENGNPKWNHVLQSLIYLDYYKPNIPYWLLVYLTRGGGPKIGRQFKLQISKLSGEIFIDGVLIKEFTMADVYSRFKKAQFHIENGKIPDREFVYNYPQEMVEYKAKVGDISATDFKKWKNDEKYISDWQCLSEGTMVRSKSGWMEVEKITVADEVLSSDGHFHSVNAVKSDMPKKQLLKVKAYNLSPIVATEDHKILVEKKGQGNKGTGDVKWVELGKLSTKYRMAYPINRTVRLIDNFDTEKLTILGFYITEGNLCHKFNGKDYRIIYCFNSQELAYAERLRRAFKKHFPNNKFTQRQIVDKRNGNKYLQISITCREAVKFIERYVNIGKAYEKSFKEEIMTLSVAKQRYMLQVMVEGDGSIVMTRNSRTVVYTSTSKKLALQFQEMMFRQGKIAGIVEQDNVGGYGSKRKVYHVRHYSNAQSRYGYIRDGIYFSPIMEITKEEVQRKVYDISVEDTQDFLTEGGIVHNCNYCSYLAECWSPVYGDKVRGAAKKGETNAKEEKKAD